MRNIWLFLASVALIMFAVAGFILIFGAGHPGISRKTSFSSVGERIYYSGIGGNGKIIPFTDGPHWMRTMGYNGCVYCHGVDGKGGFPLMMTSKNATDITYASLTSTRHHHQGESQEEEIPYTDETIKRAITEGIDSSGKKLNFIMPRWQMTEEDFSELLAYIKKL